MISPNTDCHLHILTSQQESACAPTGAGCSEPPMSHVRQGAARRVDQITYVKVSLSAREPERRVHPKPVREHRDKTHNRGISISVAPQKLHSTTAPKIEKSLHIHHPSSRQSQVCSHDQTHNLVRISALRRSFATHSAHASRCPRDPDPPSSTKYQRA